MQHDTKRPIRLAILGTQGIPAKYGGYETFAEELSTRLASMGDFEVTVYCPSPADEAPATSSYRGVDLRYVKSPGTGGLGNILFDVWSLFACLGKHDIVYMCGYGASHVAWLPRLFGAKVWINIGGLEWKRTKWHPIVRRYVKTCEWVCAYSANRVICDAQALLEYFQGAYCATASSTFIAYGAPKLPLSPDSPSLLPKEVRPHEYYLVVARLEPENNVLEIVKGYVQHASDKPLVVVGNLDSKTYVKALRDAADGRVIFLGGVYNKPRLAALRRLAFAAFHGHSVGGTNPSLLEALAAGRPIVAHDNPFNREVGGPLLKFFASPADIPPVLRALEHEARTGDLDQTEAAEAWLRKRYNWDTVAADYAALLRREANRFPA